MRMQSTANIHMWDLTAVKHHAKDWSSTSHTCGDSHEGLVGEHPGRELHPLLLPAGDASPRSGKAMQHVRSKT